MPRLKRSDCSGAGIRRRRTGRGFTYIDVNGERLTDERVIERIRNLAIPPGWTDVWICSRDNGHIQATGIDDAGRKQYLYHEHWSKTRSARKFDETLEFSRKLPKLRKAVKRDLGPEDISRKTALACAVRLMDLGFFRIGSEQYAEENETYGVATIRRDHVELVGKDGVRFEYAAKGSQERTQDVHDPAIRKISEKLLRRRSGPDDFLAWTDGRTWVDIRSTEINEYIQAHTDERFSAKDFRTWNGTVLAAVELGLIEIPDSRSGREKAVRQTVKEVAGLLGNTPAVCRSSYIDPRVIDAFRNGGQIKVPRSWNMGSSLRQRTMIEKRVRDLIQGR